MLAGGGGSNSSVPISASGKGIRWLVLTIIAGGAFTIDAADDAIHSNNTVMIDSGILAIAAKDAAIHADAVAAMNAGVLNISKSYAGI